MAERDEKRPKARPTTTEEWSGFHLGFRVALERVHDFLLDDGSSPPTTEEVKAFVDKLLAESEGGGE